MNSGASENLPVCRPSREPERGSGDLVGSQHVMGLRDRVVSRNPAPGPENHQERGVFMSRTALVILVAVCLSLILTASAIAKSDHAATPVSEAIWANDSLWGTVLTSTDFSKTGAPETTYDILYNFDSSGLSGQRSVSETWPGVPGYNGGRWHVYAVEFTEAGILVHDPDGNGAVNFELTNAEQVLQHAMTLGHLKISPTDIYFECPLRKGKGN